MLPPSTSIGFVHLAVRDPTALTAFYQDLLGFRPAHRTPDSVIFSGTGRPPYHLILTALPDGRPRGRRTAGLYHFAVLLPERSDLATALQHLLAGGYPIHGASDHGVSEAIYLSDPEGNGIELYADRPRAQWPVQDGALAMGTRPLDVDGLLAEARAPWAGLPGATRIGHIHLHVSDLHRSGAFYAGVLGFEVMVRTYPGALFLSAGGYHHHVGLNIWAGTDLAPAAPAAPGLRAFAVRLPDRDTLRAVLTRIRRAGIAVERAVDHGVGVAATVRDPDGIGVSLWVDTPDGATWMERALDPTRL